MSSSNKEILINTETMNLINTYTMELKQKLSSVLENISASNNQFVSSSQGKFSAAFGGKSMQFEKEMKEEIEKLNSISQFIKQTQSLNTELDQNIASNMDK